MAYKPPVAVYDACILYPFHLRNLLIQCGFDRLVDVRWTDAIHSEWIRNLAANAPNLSVQRLTETRSLMKRVLPTADVAGYEKHIPELTLPDLGDRHVLAAAIAGRASHIVTWNLADFPAEALAPHHRFRTEPGRFPHGSLHSGAGCDDRRGRKRPKEPQKDGANGHGVYRRPRSAKAELGSPPCCATATDSFELTQRRAVCYARPCAAFVAFRLWRAFLSSPPVMR